MGLSSRCLYFPKIAVVDRVSFPIFVAETGTITLAGLSIPPEIYPGTNFVGGTYLLSVNPEIKNRESCEKFGTSEPRFLSHFTVGGIRYTKLTAGDVGAGSAYEELYFNTFRNGMCYEVGLSFGHYNTANQDLGCRVPKAGDTDRVLEEFMRRISYSPPAAVPLPKNQAAAPKVTSFSASSAIVNGVTDRGTTQFSWTTEDADYVEFSYHCSAFGLGVVIAEQGGAGGQNCENDPKPIMPQTQQVNHAPNSTVEVGFGNFHDDPISIVVTMTPFSHGRAYSGANRSLTITIDPYNPFPQGIPNTTANIKLNYSGVARASYDQGSLLKIDWTDTLTRDSCVNLYLLQEKGGERRYVAQIVHECLRPAIAGSFTWTISDKYSGSDFRIFASTPGGLSSAFGPGFSIVQTGPKN